MSQYFPKTQSHEENIKIKTDLSNYATKEDIKNITHIDTSYLDIDKLVPVPTDLRNLSNVVKNDVVKRLHIIN